MNEEQIATAVTLTAYLIVGGLTVVLACALIREVRRTLLRRGSPRSGKRFKESKGR